MTTQEQTDIFNTLAAILLWCFVLSIALLLLWFVGFLLAGDFAYGVHSRWFELSRPAFDLMNYYGMAFVKACAIIYFLFPYIAIKIVVRKNRTT